MVIKYKNGEEYQLRRPNPLMTEQDIWVEYITHNFNWAEEKKIKDKKEELKKEIDKEKVQEVDLEETNNIKENKDVNEVRKVEEVEDIKNIEENEIEKKYTNALFLIAENIIEKDEIYNEFKTRIKYTKKRLIKIKIIEQNDLFFNFYTKEEIEKNSIVFPKNKDKRWWKIKNKNNGIYECMPSDITPSFD